MATPKYVEFKMPSGLYKNNSNDFLLILQIDIGGNSVAGSDPNLFKITDQSGNTIGLASFFQVASGAATPVDGFGVIQLVKPILLAPGCSIVNINMLGMTFGYGLQGSLEDLRGYM